MIFTSIYSYILRRSRNLQHADLDSSCEHLLFCLYCESVFLCFPFHSLVFLIFPDLRSLKYRPSDTFYLLQLGCASAPTPSTFWLFIALAPRKGVCMWQGDT
jgi:hypothetical protein